MEGFDIPVDSVDDQLEVIHDLGREHGKLAAALVEGFKEGVAEYRRERAEGTPVDDDVTDNPR